MQIEYEISFNKINPDELRIKLQNLGFHQVKVKTLMRRCVYRHPIKQNAYARIRDEGDKITCTYKEITDPNHIEGVKELHCEITDFETMKAIWDSMGLVIKNYQETYREVWLKDESSEVVIDWRPGLQPFCEIEGSGEKEVKGLVEALGFDRNEGIFGAVDQIYYKELGLEPEYINNLSHVTFDYIPRESEKTEK